MRLGKIYGKTASRVSVKLLDIVIIIGIAAMAVLIPYLSAKGGFTVSFDSLGGTAVEAQRVRCFRMNNPIDMCGYEVERETQYAMKLESSCEIVVQYGRLDNRQTNLAYYTTLGC